MRRWLFAISLLLAVPAAARDNTSIDFIQIAKGAPVSIQAERAYILYRVPQMAGTNPGDTVFYRERGPEGYTTPNFNVVRLDKPFAETAAERFYLIEVKPGTYIIAGLAVRGVPYMNTCFCMGTLNFEAKPGELTDLGYMLSDDVSKRSPFPELRDVTGRGPRINDGFGKIAAGAVRPVGSDATLPDALRSLPRVPARFAPVGKFPNTLGRMVNRMAPLPGVLGYDEDRVIDLRGAD